MIYYDSLWGLVIVKKYQVILVHQLNHIFPIKNVILRTAIFTFLYFLIIHCIACVYRWLSGVDGKPGFSKQSLNDLKHKREVDSMKYTYCTLMIDAMKLKKALEYDHNSGVYIGIENFGDGSSQHERLATDALVFLVVGLHSQWKQPIAYFFVASVSAEVQKSLILHALDELHCIGVQCVALTLDGYSTNLSTIRKLGCSTNPDDLVTYFPHPSTADPIHVFVDGCHALKLVRNQFCDLGEIRMADDLVARWSDIVTLNHVQKKEMILAANKLSDRHIDFQQQKMKVIFCICIVIQKFDS